jgi:hypothetical protein
MIKIQPMQNLPKKLANLPEKIVIRTGKLPIVPKLLLLHLPAMMHSAARRSIMTVTEKKLRLVNFSKISAWLPGTLQSMLTTTSRQQTGFILLEQQTS